MAFSHHKMVTFFEDAAQVVIDNAARIMVVVAGIVLLALSAAGYMYYAYQSRAQAYKRLYHALKVYDAPTTKTVERDGDVSFASDEEKWKEVEKVARLGVSKHGSSTAGPLFGVLLAESLLSQGKKDKALDVLEQAVKNIASSKLQDFYRLKLALIKLDLPGKKDQQEGLTMLQKAAQDTSNYAHEAALYYAGYYFWDKKEYMQVKNYWRQLIVKYGLKDAKHQSGFADDARQKLALITADI